MSVGVRFFGLVLLVLVLGTTVSAATLGPVAQKIYDSLKSRSDIARICNDKRALASATRSTVRTMLFAGEISGIPRREARAAAKRIYLGCSRLRASPQ
jgi:hypothetical protein